MKASELQCYDLINVDGKPTMVYGVMARMNRVYDTMTNDISMRRCEPITLTPEILEKNNFKVFPIKDNESQNCIGKWWHKSGSVYAKQYCLSHDSYSRGVTVFTIGFHPHTRIENLRYVHQLQHALRLCGLTEMADNFKI